MAEDVPQAPEDLLESEPLAGFLATSVDDDPHVAPVWYRYEDGVLELTTSGKKLQNLRANPRAAFSVHKAEAGIPEWMVSLQGTATVIEAEAPNRQVRRAINAKYGAEPDAFAGNTLVRIDVDRASHTVY
ncbi:MAG: pyridoxamine 5'-phosphate oxidase family protein [Halodesulfurarchaeum sp.]